MHTFIPLAVHTRHDQGQNADFLIGARHSSASADGGRFRQRLPASEQLEFPRAAGIAARQSAKARQAALAREARLSVGQASMERVAARASLVLVRSAADGLLAREARCRVQSHTLIEECVAAECGHAVLHRHARLGLSREAATVRGEQHRQRGVHRLPSRGTSWLGAATIQVAADALCTRRALRRLTRCSAPPRHSATNDSMTGPRDASSRKIPPSTTRPPPLH